MVKKKAVYSGLFSPFSVTRKLYVLICVCSIFIVSAPLLLNARKPYCANSISCIQNLTGAYEPAKVALYMGKNILTPRLFAENNSLFQAVLGASTHTGKHVYINLSNQELTAYENNEVIFDFPISSGKWHATPTGDFRIWAKLRYTHMSGGSITNGTYYDLPNVPFVMFFSNETVLKQSGFSLNASYWNANFGHPLGFGDVEMSLDNAEKLYNWVDPLSISNATLANYNEPGTPITIYGTTPTE